MSVSTLVGPTCKLCGYMLKASSGCELCLPVKEVLVWPIITEQSDIESSHGVVQEMIKLVKRRIRKVSAAERSEQGYDHTLTQAITALARTAKELAGEARKLEDREEQQYVGLGIEGRMNLFVEQFFAELPADFQLKLLKQMRDVFNKQEQSLLPETSHDS